MRLRPDFFKRTTTTVARELIGKYLVRRIGRRTVAAMITETEAYHGPCDRASHASRGKTARTQIMFGPPGSWYVYFVYGMHHCANVVTGPEGFPAAVLIRAVDMPSSHGPARLCKALRIDRQLNGLPSRNAHIWIEDRGVHIPRTHILCGPRIGVAYAGAWASKPWRFTLAVQSATLRHIGRSKFRKKRRR